MSLNLRIAAAVAAVAALGLVGAALLGQLPRESIATQRPSTTGLPAIPATASPSATVSQPPLSTGGAVGMTPQERLGSLAAEPDMASLTCGTVNFGSGVFENPAPLMLEFARAIAAAGVRPELEIFDLGHLDNAAWLRGKAPLDGPQHHDLVLGVPGGAAGTPANVTLLASRLPSGSTWSATGT